ncbi:hypothetical protein ANCCEY_15256 [Ancylostoma ceylanicum]|uniref:ABC transmembrane type-1 domain-containing protein n=1 Tax=Ancylostoma ceylanicum TaxID=53326 RepID=A0A0D6LD47_9BILA|nr:hypothetical protein ANCCEY_15256 [Ancylostoma ceylanicum]
MPMFLKDVIDTIVSGSGEPIEIIGFKIYLDTSDVLMAAVYIGLVYMSLILLKRPGIMYNINLVTLFGLIVHEMLNINGWLTLIVLAPLPIMSYLIYKVSDKINKGSHLAQQEQSNLSTIVQETFAGIRVVKAYGRENEVNDRFTQASKRYKGKLMQLVFINALFMPTVMALIGLSTILAIYVGGLFSFSGKVTLGEIAAFVSFVNMLTWPFASLGWLTSIIQRAAASQERINDFLKQKPEIVNHNRAPLVLEGKIEFRNVTFTYEGATEPAIKGLSFTIHPGQTAAFVGKTASGKSTILKLLMRQVEPQAGEILIDGQPLNKINLDLFRDQAGIVPQEVFLFSDTIANNIRFGTNHQVSDEELYKVTEYAHVRHNIEAFEHGFETMLGERGQENTTVYEKTEQSIATETGEIIIKTESAKDGNRSFDHSLTIYGILNLSLKTVANVAGNGEQLKKGQLEFVFNKECKLLDVIVIETSGNELVNRELEKFASDLLDKISRENYDHLFLFDNELGFVNEDSCSDNLIVSIAMRTR